MQRRTYQLTIHRIPPELAAALQKEQARAGRPLNDLILELLRQGLENLPAVPEPAPEPKPVAPEPKKREEQRPERKPRRGPDDDEEEEALLLRDTRQSIAIP